MAKTKYILPMVGSYEGDEPYVYATYSKKDTEVVANILAIARKSGARISFDPRYLDGAILLIAFISRNTVHDQKVKRDILLARSLFMDVVCFYLDDSYLGKEKENEYKFARYIRLNEVSILQYGPTLLSILPRDVFPGPPREVKKDS